MADTAVKPKVAVRRFDIFAEYNRRKAAEERQSAAQAHKTVGDSLRASWKPAAK